MVICDMFKIVLPSVLIQLLVIMLSKDIEIKRFKEVNDFMERKHQRNGS